MAKDNVVCYDFHVTYLGKLLADQNKEKAGRGMNAMLQMKKIDIAALTQAYEGQ